MPDIASALKAEIQRVARKEIRSETATLRKAVTLYRRDIAALKRQVKMLEQANKTLSRSRPNENEAPADVQPSLPRFSQKRLRSHRERLGLSAVAFGKLLGVSAQSIYNWEHGKTTPRAAQIAALSKLQEKRAA